MVRIAAVVLAFLLMASGSRGDQGEERPRIFLEKKIFAETSEGRKSFYEVHTVSEGENLWKILSGKSPLFPEDYPSLLREFLRANPNVKNPGKLVPGQKILVPTGIGMKTARLVKSGKSVSYRIRKGDTLSRILTSRGVLRKDMKSYLETVKEINDSVRDVNRIYAGRTILLPTREYFVPEPEKIAGAASSSAMALTRDVEEQPGREELPLAEPESQVSVPAPPAPESAAVMTGQKAKGADTTPLPPAKPAYRGLLSDLAGGLGEKWVDRGTLYLPIPTGGDVVLNLEEYPVVRFSGGIHALIDFRGNLPEEVRRLITETWKNYRVVPMDGAQGALGMIGRLLGVSGYYSVKEGLANPPVIGEDLSVSLPARWVVLRTSQSLLNGEIILIKEVPEKPDGELSAVLRYADHVGIRVLPFAYDPSANEGFLTGLDPGMNPTEETAGKSLPQGGLEALDFSLELLGVTRLDEKRIRIGGGEESFLLTVQPERVFEAGGKQFVVDTGKMSPALRTIVRNSGYSIFSLDGNESGRSILQRILAISGLSFEKRKGYLLAGGKEKGFEVRATGTFLTSRDWLENRKVREMAFVRGNVHTATRELMREIGVEVVGW